MLLSRWHKKEISIKSIILGGLLSLLLYSHNSISSPLSIAILDTGFCLQDTKVSKNIKIHPSTDLTKSNTFKCKDLSPNDRRLHGKWVINQLLNTLATNVEIEIFPYIVFDRNAHQSPLFWEKVFKDQSKFHLFIIAAGVKESKSLRNIKITTPVFTAGATIGRGINYETILWPQSQFKQENVYTIGVYREKDKDLPARPDYTVIHLSQMKYFQSETNSSDLFKGTSRATATAAAKAINKCSSNLLKRTKLKKCLNLNSTEVIIHNDKERIKILSL